MTEQEISVKLTETEQRAKSNTHRIEKLEQQQKGGKRWDAMIDRVLYVLIGAAISLLMTGGSL